MKSVRFLSESILCREGELLLEGERERERERESRIRNESIFGQNCIVSLIRQIFQSGKYSLLNLSKHKSVSKVC